ncbi:NrsF family protein [Rhizobiaceae bacterium n13]|uniref:NrsF family protein n=1 Tax=Ferirhizobium litorale TaxID=2927786 RepID=A0AAE3QDC2_9HYPH|nr:NrsF family protein [Fererhizobium litorale]MDI7860992.1 NrsF family protein [Fererhizobium litorale]MDI7921139.1 NrsF family protein [Fererhizobium litorale]
MKTDDLINLMAQDAPVRMRLGRMMGLALLAGVAVSVAILVLTIGLRHNMSTVVETARVLFKVCVTLVLAITACRLVFQIGRPGVPVRTLALTLLVPAAMVVLAVAVELLVLPQQQWATSLIGGHPFFCMAFIPVLALAPLTGFLLALRAGAPGNPGLAGAAAGLAAGGIAAAVYAWHCPDDSPLFLATWYTIAIAVVTAIGFVAGRRLLRW